MIKPSVPKGTRDFGPDVLRRRKYIIESIRNVYELHGFAEIETPAVEQIATLTGKYGDEGDKLMFRVLNNGDFMSGVPENARESGQLLPLISDRGLRYDLTIPFARFVAMHRNEIQFPFRRYQIQPVWRADRPQKGRYREFWQCDADIIGSTGLSNEVELIRIMQRVFAWLELDDIQIRINHRKLLTGMVELAGGSDDFLAYTVLLDKVDKIGPEMVLEQMQEAGFSAGLLKSTEVLLRLAEGGLAPGDLSKLHADLGTSPSLDEAITELRRIFDYLGADAPHVRLYPSLARGLNYYTGTILEAVPASGGGSIAGGGRYDDLTGLFGLPDVSGVGMSFGLDRIYDLMEERGLFRTDASRGTQIMFAMFDDDTPKHAYPYLQRLREGDVAAELYPDNVKMGKQFKYADARNIPYVALLGAEEVKNGTVTLKTMKTGEQQTLSMKELLVMMFDN